MCERGVQPSEARTRMKWPPSPLGTWRTRPSDRAAVDGARVGTRSPKCSSAHVRAKATLVELHSQTTGVASRSTMSDRGFGWAEALPLQWAAHDDLKCSGHGRTRATRPPCGGLDFHLVDYPSGKWGGARPAPSRLHFPVAGAPSGRLGVVQECAPPRTLPPRPMSMCTC